MSFLESTPRLPRLRLVAQSLGRYAALLILVLAATGLLHGVALFMGKEPALIMLILLAIRFGLLPGIFATSVVVIYIDLFILPSLGSLWLEHPHDALRLIALAINGVLVSYLSQSTIYWNKLKASVVGRKNAEEILIATEQKLRLFEFDLNEEKARLTTLINSFSEEVWLIDAHGQIQAINSVAAEKFGMATGELIDLRQLVCNLEIYEVDGTLRAAEDAPPLQVLRTGKAILNQEEVVRLIGSNELQYRSVSATPIKNTAGKVVGAVAVVRDITSQKLAAFELEKMRLLMQEGERIAHLGSWEYVVATQKTVWSAEEYCIYGLDPSRPSPDYQTLLSTCIHPDDAVQLDQVFRSCLEKLDSFTMEHRIVKPDGSLCWVYDQAHPYLDEKGQLVRYVGTTLDITERKVIEQALKDSEQRWQFALEGAGDGLWDWNAETNKVFYSNQWKTMLGYTADEIGDSLDEWDQRVHPDDKAAVYAEINKLLAREIPIFSSEHRILCKDGSYKWILDRGKVINWSVEGKALRVIGTHSDISVRKLAEQTRAIYERQLKQQRTRIEVTTHLHIAAHTASAIAHELNQPLTAIVAYCAIARQLLTQQPVNCVTLQTNLDKTQQLAQRAGQSIREMLILLNKIEAPDEVVDCGVVVDDIIAILLADGEIGPFRILRTIEPSMKKLSANRLQIEKILINLLRNAIQAMRDRDLTEGSIEVMACTRAGTPAMAQLSVRDTGVGLDAASLEWIFQPFHTTKATGLGLGLTISRSLIEASGGKLWAEANDGPGATFHFTLPFAK